MGMGVEILIIFDGYSQQDSEDVPIYCQCPDVLSAINI